MIVKIDDSHRACADSAGKIEIHQNRDENLWQLADCRGFNVV
jgi:hypothetical protein